MTTLTHVKSYKTKSGAIQFKPSFAWCQDADGEGFCLACGETQDAEPDARRYVCDSCGAPKVYGNEELVLMNLCF